MTRQFTITSLALATAAILTLAGGAPSSAVPSAPELGSGPTISAIEQAKAPNCSVAYSYCSSRYPGRRFAFRQCMRRAGC